MTVIPKHPGAQVDGTPTIDEEQRERLYGIVAEEPYIGHLRAGRQAGIRGTGGQIRRLLEADEGFQEAVENARAAFFQKVHMAPEDLFLRLAAVTVNENHRSQFQAIAYALGVHGITVTERTSVEHSGAGGGSLVIEIEDRSASLAEIAAVLESVGALAERGDAAAGEVSGARRLLAAPPDGQP